MNQKYKLLYNFSNDWYSISYGGRRVSGTSLKIISKWINGIYFLSLNIDINYEEYHWEILAEADTLQELKYSAPWLFL